MANKNSLLMVIVVIFLAILVNGCVDKETYEKQQELNRALYEKQQELNRALEGDAQPTIAVVTHNGLDNSHYFLTSNKVWFRPIQNDFVDEMGCVDVNINGVGRKVCMQLFNIQTQLLNDSVETDKTSAYTKYDVIIESEKGKSNGAFFRTLNGQNIEALPFQTMLYDFSITNFSDLRCRVRNGYMGELLWSEKESKEGKKTNKFIVLSENNRWQSVINNTYSVVNNTNISISPLYMNFTYHFQCLTNNAYSQFGISSAIAVDYISEYDLTWDKIIVSQCGKEQLRNIYNSLDEIDMISLSNYDGVYELSRPIGGITPTNICITLISFHSTVVPAKPLAVKFLASGIKESVRVPETFLGIGEFDGGAPRFYDDKRDNGNYNQIATTNENVIIIPFEGK